MRALPLFVVSVAVSTTDLCAMTTNNPPAMVRYCLLLVKNRLRVSLSPWLVKAVQSTLAITG